MPETAIDRPAPIAVIAAVLQALNYKAVGPTASYAHWRVQTINIVINRREAAAVCHR
jgi:hypothetical protein